jgi:MFS family permease
MNDDNAGSRSYWVLALMAGLVLFLALGQRHSFGLYLIPITLERGWSRETFSIAIAVQNLVWGAAQPFSGAIADRHGPRPVMIIGALLYALGLAAMPYATSGIAFSVVAGLLIGLGLSGTGFAIVYGAVGRGVSAQARPKALALVGAVGGAGQFLMLPVNQTAIDGLGWSTALIGMGLLFLALIPLAVAIPKPPAAAPGAEASSVRAALRTCFGDRDFWLITVGFLSCGFQLAFIATHLPAFLADQRLSTSVATTALGLVALSNIVGTYQFGLWTGRWQKKTLSFWLYLGRTLAILAFVWLPISAWTVYAFAVVMGFLWLGTVPLVNGLLSQMYGLRHLSMLFGIVFLSHQVGSFLGVWLGGAMFDRYQTYTGVWLLAAVLSLVSALVHLPIRERRTPAAAAA